MTVDDEIAIAIGEMGLSLETYLSLTPFQFWEARKRFIEKVESDREWEETTRWNIARWQVWRAMCPPDKKTISVFDLLELPGDGRIKEKQKEQESNEERYRKAINRFGKKK